MLTIRKEQGQKIIELGGGNNPHPAADVNVDVREGPKVHFTADFDKPLPISSNEWDGVISIFALEHVSYTRIPAFLREVYRILKSNGRFVCIIPNTEAQVKWILAHPDGWDGHAFFESASCKLFGDQEHSLREGEVNAPVDSHKAWLDPLTASKLFQDAGFVDITIQPYGERETDMAVIVIKPKSDGVLDQVAAIEKTNVELVKAIANVEATKTPYDPVKTFNRQYFNGIGYKPWYWDFPFHEIAFRNILSRRPESVLELGCGRGYILKRLKDVGILVRGWDVSKHCQLTKVSELVMDNDCLNIDAFHCGAGIVSPDWVQIDRADLCLSVAFLEHVPEHLLPALFEGMSKWTKRGLHAIVFDSKDDCTDPTRVTSHSRAWWTERLPKGHEVIGKDELESGTFPQDVLKGDGKIKLNCGSYMTCFHHGWINIDQHELAQWAQGNGYTYQKHDLRQGIPFDTDSVDMIYHAHFLEHLSYKDGRTFLADARRVIKSDGIMRCIVPDAGMLMHRFREGQLSEFDELNENCANAMTSAGKLWSLLWDGHQAIYDADTLCSVLSDVGWEPKVVGFRQSNCPQMLTETLDVCQAISLFVEAKPRVK